MTRLAFALPLALVASACTASASPPPESAAPPPPASDPAQPAYPGEATNVLSQIDAQRLIANKGVTLQWIDWDRRGAALVAPADGLWTLRAAQTATDRPGRLLLDGAILEIGEGYFTFRGTIRITDTPDAGRVCEATKNWHFAITQNRRYYRLREFEWCDDLTDYIDIYF